LHEQLSLTEVGRLIDVVLAWLEVERDRKQPFQVEITEQARVLDVAGLHLNIRIDRIDRLRNGKFLLIDYKSGDTSAANLNKERPREPQLLAYAAAMRDEVDGFFFAQLKPRDEALVGYARELHADGQKPPGKNVRWSDYLQNRIEVVERLAESFVAGEAAVDPLPGACQYCGVTPFCRVNELRYGRSEDRDD
jgi:RecB family exonuclease